MQNKLLINTSTSTKKKALYIKKLKRSNNKNRQNNYSFKNRLNNYSFAIKTEVKTVQKYYPFFNLAN